MHVANNRMECRTEARDDAIALTQRRRSSSEVDMSVRRDPGVELRSCVVGRVGVPVCSRRKRVRLWNGAAGVHAQNAPARSPLKVHKRVRIPVRSSCCR
jgi:hypothetical protein